MNLNRTQLMKKPVQMNRYTALRGRKFWVRRRARRARAPAPTAPPPHPRTAAARSAATPSKRQLCARGPNASFPNMYSHPDSLPQAAALQPGYFGAAAPPRPSRSIVRCGKAAAARAQNAPRSCLIYAPNSPRRQINFWPRLPVLPRGFAIPKNAEPTQSRR